MGSLENVRREVAVRDSGAVRVGPVVEMPLSALRPWEENPRKVRPERLDDLTVAMERERGMLRVRPLLVLPDGTVVAGNQRLAAAKKLGWESIPVVVVEGLSEAQMKTWALLDNQAFGEWDRPALAEFLAGLLGEGVDAVLTGFETRELDSILATLTPPADPDELPPVPREPLSRPGDLYELGEHRLVCGDSTDSEVLARAVAGESVAALVSDFPWGVGYEGKTAEALTIENDTATGLPEFLAASFRAFNAVLGPRVPFYLFVPSGPAGTEFRLALRAVGWEHRQTLIWCKDTLVLGHSDFHYRHEEILYGFTPGKGRGGRGGGRGSRWYGGNAQSSVLFFDRPKRSREHPTAKPVALMAALIRCSSRRGELVLDPFAGSGSTLLACETLGRRCAAVELDERYADVIRSRFERVTAGG
jgi:site-specific DNA-methyltransferase (adenine-specific)